MIKSEINLIYFLCFTEIFNGNCWGKTDGTLKIDAGKRRNGTYRNRK